MRLVQHISFLVFLGLIFGCGVRLGTKGSKQADKKPAKKEASEESGSEEDKKPAKASHFSHFSRLLITELLPPAYYRTALLSFI